MSTSRYKGFRVLARPYQLHDSKRWTVDIEIRRNGRCLAFSTNGRYRTEHEAGAHCYCLARRIIDGAEPRWSVDYLRAAPRNRRAFTRIWTGRSMTQLLVAGVVLLAVGSFLLLRGAGFTSGRDAPDEGVAGVSTRERLAITPPLGGTAVAAGVVLLVAGVRKRP